ncbi:MAG: apolipoprotein N-acyltransferase [Syntrophales bacterium]|jgi:apolipoprotein N-acyltransferase|nr:apolipoprotein N-acyltransferase [Syntrophales bacterium]
MTQSISQKIKRGLFQNYPSIGLSLFSGVLLICSFPKFGVGLVAWFAFVPLFFALRTTHEPLKAAGWGFLTGMVCHIGLLYWISHVVVMYGYLPLYIGISAMILLSCFLSVYFSVFSAALVFLRNKGYSEIVSAPLLWTCLEFLKSHLFTGFPWENLAYSQYKYLTIIQFVDITGIYGLSFIIMFVNLLLFDLVGQQGDKRKIVNEWVAGCIILTLLIGYGKFSLDRIHAELKQAEAMEVSLIQGNIDQNIKWDSRYQEESIEIYRNMSLAKAPVGRGLIVWPETAAPFFFQEPLGLSEVVRGIPRLSSDWLLLGSPSYTEENRHIFYMNSAFLVSPEGKITGKYDKVHLVPYGEYVPLRKYFPFINKLVAGIGDFRKGETNTPLPFDNHSLGILICYEGIFPELSRAYKKYGVKLLVNITNDAWFGHTSAPYQHLSMTVFRAVENRLFFLRSANTGISAIISPSGQIIKNSELFQRTALRGSVKFLDRRTIYALYGDIFVYFCLLLLGAVFFSSIKGELLSCWKILSNK